MQGHRSGRLNVPTISRLESCIVDIYACFGAKRLQLNADKTDRATVVWSGVATVSAAISEQWHQRQPVHRKGSDCRPRPGRVVRRRAINALARFSDMFHHGLRTEKPEI